ncbi:hypothetical protein D3C72_2203100 [compost metagenome]
MVGKNVHVVPTDFRWAVQYEGGGDREVFETQSEAFAYGTDIARRDKVQVLLYGRDGKIQMRQSFGNDPHNMKG